MPSFSIITPSLNQAHFIERMFASVQMQQHPGLEHIVIDGGSRDGTIDWLRAREDTPGFRWLSEPDDGQSDAINKGVRLATGEIVGWLNADDELYPGALAAMDRAFREHPDAVLIYGAGSKIDESGRVQKEIPERPFDRKRLQRSFYFLQPSMFFRRSAFLEVGGLDLNLHYAMDWDFLLRLPRHAEIRTLPNRIGKLRCYAATKSSTGGWARMREIAHIGRRHHGRFDRNHVAFVLRDRIARVRSISLRKNLQCLLDRAWPALCGAERGMVEGWPEEN